MCVDRQDRLTSPSKTDLDETSLPSASDFNVSFDGASSTGSSGEGEETLVVSTHRLTSDSLDSSSAFSCHSDRRSSDQSDLLSKDSNNSLYRRSLSSSERSSEGVPSSRMPNTSSEGESSLTMISTLSSSSSQIPPPLPPKKRQPFDGTCLASALEAAASHIQPTIQPSCNNRTRMPLPHQETLQERLNYISQSSSSLSCCNNRSYPGRASADDLLAVANKGHNGNHGNSNNNQDCGNNNSNSSMFNNKNRCNQEHERLHFHTLKCHPRLQNWNTDLNPGDFSSQPRRKSAFSLRVPPKPPPRHDSVDVMTGLASRVTLSGQHLKNESELDPPELPVKLRPKNNLPSFSCTTFDNFAPDNNNDSSNNSVTSHPDIKILPVMMTNIDSNQIKENKESPVSSFCSPIKSSAPNNLEVSTTSSTTTYSCQSSYSSSSSWSVKYSFSCPHHLSSQCLSNNKTTCQGGHDALVSTRDSSSSTFPSGFPRDQRPVPQETTPITDPGKPPPLPPKKKNVMAYMTVVGTYRGPSDAAFKMYRHSVHAHHGCNRRDGPRAGGDQSLRQTEIPFVQQHSLDLSMFMMPARPLTLFPNQANIVDVSSIRSRPEMPEPISSTDENAIPASTVASSPPLLPPKTFRRKISPPQLPLVSSSNLASRTAIISSPTDIPDVVSSSTKPDNNCISNGSSEGKLNITEQEGPLQEMDVNQFLILKSAEEEGPDIKGGPLDALVVKATEVSKNGLSFCLPFIYIS